MVVNTIVAMSIAYLFTVRYLRSTSLSWQGALGTPAVLFGVGGVAALQLAFTYLPLMNRAFETRPVPLGAGVVVIMVGVLLFIALEVEKRVQRRYGALIERALAAAAEALQAGRPMLRAAARLRRRLD